MQYEYLRNVDKIKTADCTHLYFTSYFLMKLQKYHYAFLQIIPNSKIVLKNENIISKIEHCIRAQ